jgi:hypothetical protein
MQLNYERVHREVTEEPHRRIRVCRPQVDPKVYHSFKIHHLLADNSRGMRWGGGVQSKVEGVAVGGHRVALDICPGGIRGERAGLGDKEMRLLYRTAYGVNYRGD